MIRFTVTLVQPQGEDPMTYAQFQARMAKAKRWYYPDPRGDPDVWAWWQTHDEAEQERQRQRYARFDGCREMIEMAEEAFNA